MKILITALLLVAAYTANASTLESEVICDFAKTNNHQGIKTITINSGNPGNVTIAYTNGQNEVLAPEETIGGTFNEYYYPPQIEFTSSAKEKVNVKVSSQSLGTIQLNYVCNKPYTTSCSSFSGGNYSRIAITAFNISGSIFKFNGRKLPYCKRTRI